MSTEPSTTKDKGYRPTDRPCSAAPKLPKPLSSVDELQGLGDVMKYKRVVSNPKNDISMAMGTESTTLGENSRPEDTSAVEKPMPEKRAAALWSSKRGKESKKNNQGRRRILNGRTRTPATFTVSPYPTQRPPRKRPTRKPIIVRESSEGAKLGPEDQDLNKVSGTRWRHLEGSDHNEITLEQSLSPEESRQKDLASPECASGKREESEFHMAEEVFDPESIPAGVELSASDIIHGEDLIAPADKPLAFSLPTKPIKKSRSGVQGLMWAYATKGRIDESLGDAGVWFWRKPETHFRTQPPLRTEKFDHSVLAPVVVSHERTSNDEPIVELDGDTVHILPHEQCWEDIRSHEFHPDFLIPWKLAEYQASEAAGYQVWRHDRELLECRKPGCHAMISDYHRSAVVCLGCGPKSVVRYCSLQHQLEDVEGHWKECGTWGLTLQCVIDHTTAPSKFARMCPAIKQRHGRTTAALHRQVLYCALTYGHYTLFHSAPKCSETLCWPKQDPKWPEMDRRIERLLNVAFFDSWNTYVLGYLYRLLRELLRARGRWSQSTESSLKLQLETEFINYKVNTNWHNGDAPCQCEWSGKFLPRYDHLSTCWEYSPAAAHDGPVWRQNCIEATVVDYEERFWILRAWRQQHPTQNNWRLRAAGYGFPSTIPDEDCYDLGPGWTGWGGEKDNICEDQSNQGEKLSMRSI